MAEVINVPIVNPINLRLFKVEYDNAIASHYPNREEVTKEILDTIVEKGISYLVFMGDAPTFADLPLSDNKIGDVYNIVETNNRYFWSGSEWLSMGGSGEGGGTAWSDITDKPDQFPPSPHIHTIEDVPEVKTWAAPVQHDHAVFTSEVNGFVPSPGGESEESYLRNDGTWGNMQALTTEEITAIWNEEV